MNKLVTGIIAMASVGLSLQANALNLLPVSYTHLTLPTILRV